MQSHFDPAAVQWRMGNRGIEFESVVDHPLDEVFAWPGGAARSGRL
jgi:hypothetical protein